MPRLPAIVVLLLLAGACASAGKGERPAGERPAYRRLSPAVAYELLRDNPDVLVLDLRPADSFLGDSGHLRRAKNVPVGQLPELLAGLATFRQDTVVVYCDSEECAARGMSLLVAAGFGNALLMDGGIDAWIRQGFKTELPLAEIEKSRPAAGIGRPLRPLRPGEIPAPAPHVESSSAPPPRPRR